MWLPLGGSIIHIISARHSLLRRFHTTTMKFSHYALAAAVLASSANAFAGSQITPRFGLQVRTLVSSKMIPCALFRCGGRSTDR